MTLDLRQLRYFVAVAEEGHVTRAAEKLGIGQPPLSQQIKALEQQLGHKLFRRRPRGVELTACGRVLFLEARDILGRLEQAERAVRHTGRGERGELRLGVAPTAPFHPFVPAVIRGFRDTHPDVTVGLDECLSGPAIQGLRDARLDAAFVRANLADRQGLAVHRILDEPMVMALPAGHALAAAETIEGIRLSRFADDSFIAFARKEGPGMFEATLAACLAAGFTPRIGQDAPRITSTLSLVAVGLGVAMVPRSAGCMHLEGIVFRELSAPDRPTVPINLVYPSTSGSAVLESFVAHVRLMARSFAEGSR